MEGQLKAVLFLIDLNEEFAKRNRLDYNSVKDINERTWGGIRKK